MQTGIRKQKIAHLYAITAVLIWSTVASAFKLTLRHMDFLQLLFFSSFTSIIVLFAILIIQNKVQILKTYKKEDYLRSLLLGTLNPFLYYVVLFKAYSLLKAQEALTLNYTWSIMIVILSILLLKQKIKISSIFAIVLSFIGVVFIATEGRIFELSFTNLTGVLLALGSSIIWAVFWIYNISDMRETVPKLFLNFCFGFPFILIFTLIYSKLTFPKFEGLFGAIYIGAFEMGITFIFWLNALKLSKTTATVANLIYLSPFISLVLIRHLVGEKILASSIIGLVLIITGIIIQQIKSDRH